LAELGIQCETRLEGDPEILTESKNYASKKEQAKNHNDKLWDDKWNELREYKRLNGNALVPNNSKKYKALASWCQKQRKLRKDGTLPADRQAKLDTVGFPWSVSSGGEQETWFTYYEKLEDFHAANGHCLVPTTGKKELADLGVWCLDQREHKDFLSDKQVKMLDKLGFTWDEVDLEKVKQADSIWNENFKKLRRWLRKNNASFIPPRLIEDQGLASWAARQRLRFAKGVLSRDHQEKLASIGFAWTEGEDEDGGGEGGDDDETKPSPKKKKKVNEKLQERYDQAWDKMFEELKSVGTTAPIKGNYTLAVWANKQRVLHQKGNLPADRKEKLDSIGFVWRLRNRQAQKTWLHMFER
jgi:hypothetical protein